MKSNKSRHKRKRLQSRDQDAKHRRWSCRDDDEQDLEFDIESTPDATPTPKDPPEMQSVYSNSDSDSDSSSTNPVSQILHQEIQLTRAEQQIKTLTQQLNDTKQQLADSGKCATVTKDDLNTLRQDLRSFHEEEVLTKFAAQVHACVAEFYAKLKTVNTEQPPAEHEVQCECATARMEAMQKTKLTVENELEQEQTQAEKSLQVVRSECDHKIHALEQSHKEELQSMQQRLDATDQELQQMLKHHQAMQKEVQSLQATNAKLSESLAMAYDTNQADRASYNQNLRLTIAQLKSHAQLELDALRTELHTLADAKAQAEQQLEQVKIDTQQQLNAAQQANLELGRALNVAQQELDDVQNKKTILSRLWS